MIGMATHTSVLYVRRDKFLLKIRHNVYLRNARPSVIACFVAILRFAADAEEVTHYITILVFKTLAIFLIVWLVTSKAYALGALLAITYYLLIW